MEPGSSPTHGQQMSTRLTSCSGAQLCAAPRLRALRAAGDAISRATTCVQNPLTFKLGHLQPTCVRCAPPAMRSSAAKSMAWVTSSLEAMSRKRSNESITPSLQEGAIVQVQGGWVHRSGRQGDEQEALQRAEHSMRHGLQRYVQADKAG